MRRTGTRTTNPGLDSAPRRSGAVEAEPTTQQAPRLCADDEIPECSVQGLWRDTRWRAEDEGGRRVTSSTRVLAPRCDRRSRASSSWQGRHLLRGRTSHLDKLTLQHQPPLTVPEAVDLWRQLFQTSSAPDMGDIDRAVQSGGYALPRDLADNMIDTIRDMDMHDRSIMTVALIDLLGRLMSECAQVLAQAHDDMEEVEVETSDHASLMQTHLNAASSSLSPARTESSTTPVVARLQQELFQLQQKGNMIHAYVAELLVRLRRQRVREGTCETLDLLQSLLVTVQNDLEEQSLPQPVQEDVDKWVSAWWSAIMEMVTPPASSSLDIVLIVQGHGMEEGEELALAERDYKEEQKRWAAERQRQQDAHESEESSWESEMARIAAMYDNAGSRSSRAWDDWALYDEMHRTTRPRRRSLDVTLATGGEGTEVVKKVRVSMPGEVPNDARVVEAQLVEPNSSMSSAPPTVLLSRDCSPKKPPGDPEDGGRGAIPHSLQFQGYLEQSKTKHKGKI